MATSIWNATAVTPAATDRLPVDTGAAGTPSRWTGQNVADAAGFIGKTHNALGSISTNTAINLASGTYVSATIGAALTFTFTNPPASPNGCEFTLVLTNGGAYTITWPGSVSWAGGTAPTLTASGVNVLHFATGNGGTNWYGWAEVDEVYQPLDTELTALASTTSAADALPYFTGAGTASTTTLTAAARTVLDDTTTAAMLTTLGAQAVLPFTSAESTASPNNTVYVDSLTANGSTTNVDLALIPKGIGALLAAIPDSGVTGGNKRGTNAVDWQTSRAAAARVASGNFSAIVGGAENTASGTHTVVGGSANTASGTYAVSFGNNNTASATNAVAIGSSNTASGTAATVFGQGNTAGGGYSWISGGFQATTRGLTGARAYAYSQRSALGDNEFLGMICRATTTGTTTTSLTAGGAAVSSTNVMVLPNNSAASGFVVIQARDASANNATWIRAFRVTRGANAASTAVVFDVDMITPNLDAALSTATAVVAADTTQGALVINVTGVAATTIDWLSDQSTIQIVR
jgi:hypothetical protein